MVNYIAELLKQAPGTFDIREPFLNYGLSSLDAVTLSGELEELLGCRLSPTLAYEYPSIFSLSRYLGGDSENDKSTSLANSVKDGVTEPIAIIGMGCRFPGAKDPESFWHLLRDGVDAITEIPPDRWEKESFYNPDPSVPGKSISYWGGFLNNIDQFDATFFGISPVEAKYMDPQQRLLLELSYEALDDAGQNKVNLDGTKTGVYIGISANEYSSIQFSDPSIITSHSGTGNALSIAANRISYYFNFRGPSIAIDTACSSSLSAVHLACQSIRNGECKMALAGGVNMILSAAQSIAFSKAGVLAPDGRCKTFDSRANGYVRGEGAGLVVLKPLSVALADGDPIHALIMGSAVSQDGRTNGLMAPSSESQEAMLREAYQAAGILPGSVQYVEAHGTGTLLGDSMEAKALGAVVGVNRTTGPCAIGSVKTNIGHLEAASGIAGLLKVILSLKHRMIPPNLHYNSPNPHIHFDELNLSVHNRLNPWPSVSGPALAGISSFGFGGTNVHMIVREADYQSQEKKYNEKLDSTTTDFHLLPLSENNYENLRSIARAFQEILASYLSVATKDICIAAGQRRSQFNYRLAVSGNSREQLHNSLEAFICGKQDPNLFFAKEVPGPQPKLVFVFPGQGGQWYGMGRELLKQESVFYEAIEKIDIAIKARFNWSLMDVLYAEESISRLEEIDVLQPCLFAIQVALATLWKSWGITPDAVIGHSMGEIAAAYISGILTMEDAIQIVCYRSQLLKGLCGKGRMMVTELSVHEAKELLKTFGNDIAIAVINSPTSTVLSGTPEKINEVMSFLQGQNLFCKMINVDVASHSPQMDELQYDLLRGLGGLQPKTAKIPFYSTVSGARGVDLNFNSAYWMDNLRKPVLFSDAISQLFDDGYTAFVEIGPHPVLLGSIQQTLQSSQGGIRLLPSLRRGEPERETLLGTLGTLYTEGFSISWDKLYPNKGRHVQLPLIHWQRQRYWMDVKPPGVKSTWNSVPVTGKNVHPLLGDRITLANSPSTFIWQTELNDEIMNVLKDHQVEDEIVFPAAAYIEMALQSAQERGLYKSHLLSDFVFKERMILHDGKPTTIQALLAPSEEGNFLFSVYSRNDQGETWKLHASVNFIENRVADGLAASIGTSHDVIRQQAITKLNADEFYKSLQLRGIQYGPDFRGIQQVWNKGNESLGLVSLPDSLQDTSVFQIHPALLDAGLQVLATTLTTSFEQALYLPTGCRYIRFFSRPGRVLWSHVTLQSELLSAADSIIADIRFSDENNQTIAEFIGFRVERVNRHRSRQTRQDTWLYDLHWRVKETPLASNGILHERKNWLIFADDDGLGEDLAKQLELAGDHCYLLPYRETIKKLDSLHEGAPLEIEKRLKEIPSLYGIIHLWSITTSSATSNVLENAQMTGCNSVVNLVKALSIRIASFPRLWLVTRGAQSVNDGEQISIEQSALWGLGKVISFEFPELKCIRIDIDPLQSNAEMVPRLFKQLSEDNEDQIALRADDRFVLRISPFTLATSFNSQMSLRSDCTYLITGGLGALGLATANWMAKCGARHLVLLGRTEPDLRALNIIDQMRHHDVEVVIEQADVSNRSQLEYVFDKIERNMPVLRGVIHAAGVLDDCSILNLDSVRMKKVMAPKVDGTWNLHLASLNLPLDFFVLYSSAVSVLGSPGQGNYAAASSFLDAMANYRRNLGLSAISINWGPWAEIGLAAEATERLKEQNASTQHLVKMIEIDQGLKILELLLKESAPQVVVLPFDLKNLVELYPTAAEMPFFAEIGGSDTHVARLYGRPNLRQKYVAPGNDIERKLAELWRQTLHIDRVGIHDSFFELGGDSVLAAQILTLAQKTFGIRINPQDAFQAFTIKRLAEMLEEEIMKQINEMTDEEAQERLSAKN